jgi:hypothetical protein
MEPVGVAPVANTSPAIMTRSARTVIAKSMRSSKAQRPAPAISFVPSAGALSEPRERAGKIRIGNMN